MRIGVAAIGVGPLGTQVAGVVDAVGPESAGFARGDRVTFRADAPLATRIIVPEHDLVGVPADVSLDDAVGVMPCAALARTVVKQVRPVRRGDRVRVAEDTSVVRPYVAAWAEYLGAEVVDEGPADATITRADVAAARMTKTGHGLAQQAASDVYAAIRAGAFDAVGPAGRIVHPGEVTLAA